MSENSKKPAAVDSVETHSAPVLGDLRSRVTSRCIRFCGELIDESEEVILLTLKKAHVLKKFNCRLSARKLRRNGANHGAGLQVGADERARRGHDLVRVLRL